MAALKESDPTNPEYVRTLPYAGEGVLARTQLAWHLPPMYNLDDIFQSIAQRAMELGLDKYLSHVGSRPLRVVTVCSGTESPLLALELLQENLRKFHNRELAFEHLFSAEIVPFKQAYIERNFHPPLLFRDVTELKGQSAQTAYGSLAQIPEDVDLLVAGFSCVDFSNLNNKQKTLDETGESSGTLRSILAYANVYRPRLVIVENVKSAPWSTIKQYWIDIGYCVVQAGVDTKAYYIPQTRERGYMCCVDAQLLAQHGLSTECVLSWTSLMAGFTRQASSPAGMFLLDADDRRLHQISKSLTLAAPRLRAWDKYQLRHQAYRQSEHLGYKRPYTRSLDSGTCLTPDFSWHGWNRSLNERVWDTLDMNFLRKLKEGYDMSYKERCIDLSQGVEREIDVRASGIVGCITPNGIPYLTSRGGPLCGLEALALQGLPLDRLCLTRETLRELLDLAGNAMSSTVVGCAMLSALILGYKVLRAGEQSSTSTEKQPKRQTLCPQDDCMIINNLQLKHAVEIDTQMLQERAARSARYCMCEGQLGVEKTILQCTLCGHTACGNCAGNPPHAFKSWSSMERIPPMTFVGELRSILPARLVLTGVSRDIYSKLAAGSTSCPPQVWTLFWEVIDSGIDGELSLLDIKRSGVWTIQYEGKMSKLDLVISEEGVEWLLYASTPSHMPSLSLIREILSKPIARLRPENNSFLNGEWELCTLISRKSHLNVCGSGRRIDSYEVRCGHQDPQFVGAKVWTHIDFQGSDEDVQDFGADIRGSYELLPDCGTAFASLHRKIVTAGNEPSVYLFLDSTKLGKPENDSFIFSWEHRLISGYERRRTIAEVSHTWRSWKASDVSESLPVYHRKWIKAPAISVSPLDCDSLVGCHSLAPSSRVTVCSSGCCDTNITLLSFKEPMTEPDHLNGQWEVIHPIDSSSKLRGFGWLLQKAAGLTSFKEWQDLVYVQTVKAGSRSICNICAPPKPHFIWGRDRQGHIATYEDPREAALYERQMKLKPSPFLFFRRFNQTGPGDLRVTLNIQVLLHQAYDRLYGAQIVEGTLFQWRLLPNSYDARNHDFSVFNLLNNRNDSPSLQPPNFLLKLRSEQLRSLSWMVEKESDNIAPFWEEEAEEALLPQMMWRAEARVLVPKTVHGGVLADDVGYGKTALILGLIDMQHEHLRLPNLSLKDGFIPAKATLVVVPGVLLRQWELEIKKFLGSTYRVLVISHIQDLAKATIEDILFSDIILVSWTVFNGDAYYQKLQNVTATPRKPGRKARDFDSWLKDALGSLKDLVRVLGGKGPGAFLELVRSKRQTSEDSQARAIYQPSKRLKGKSYADAAQKRCSDYENEEHVGDNSSTENDSSPNKEESDDSLQARVSQCFEQLPSNMFVLDDAHELESTVELSKSDGSNTQQLTSTSSTKRRRGRSASDKNFCRIWNDSKELNVNGQPDQTWTAIKNLSLHAFAFSRLIIDEFTYADDERLKSLLALEARSKWVLSGTPPLNDFADVKSIASFLGVHLGVDDDEFKTQNSRHRLLSNQRSDAERFQSYRTSHSEAWHHNRHEIAQRFLHRFVCKNVAEIGEIPFTEHIILICLTPVEKALYSELYRQLEACEGKLRSQGRYRPDCDQASRLDEMISSSTTGEEALLKRCACIAGVERWTEAGSPETINCESLIKLREQEIVELQEELVSKLKLAAWMYCECDSQSVRFDKFVKGVTDHNFGDNSVTAVVCSLLGSAVRSSHPSHWTEFFAPPAKVDSQQSTDKGEDRTQKREGRGKSVKVSKPQKSAGQEEKGTSRAGLPPKPTGLAEIEPMLREVTTVLKTIIDEWVLRKRGVRFLKKIRSMQIRGQISKCTSCNNRLDSVDNLSLLGSCGHSLCKDCLSLAVQKEECSVEGCRGSGKYYNVIPVSTLERDSADRNAEFGGSKLDKVIEIIRSTPQGERILLFIQFPELMKVAAKALNLAKIKHTMITAVDANSAAKISKLQASGFGQAKVLILNLGTEMAAGLNLQHANHVIFLSPMLTQTQYDYDSTMTQAIGRSRRYGQNRHVHIYHLLAKKTIDVDIFENRRDKVLIEKDGKHFLATDAEVTSEKKVGSEGQPMV
ncbi:putative SNF2 family helicase [Aspergillus saccharolyticus JOP 1030-1]|uniref:C-5 cytosine-specific DNA methylase n=1 Tax=Aspergillus saccharolyticus JOP 1030-1 TaxID=1450539 RepID=A0A318Z7J9_9EURO|nr:C-5 cytosine-specific DNA methylase [Aspergillus saccharolyticus JOP 1030-1]PYH43146.1 C-5 cytosine-specific DNA methylase [Aspergillus saccharolyticus JOP 1030-1]